MRIRIFSLILILSLSILPSFGKYIDGIVTLENQENVDSLIVSKGQSDSSIHKDFILKKTLGFIDGFIRTDSGLKSKSNEISKIIKASTLLRKGEYYNAETLLNQIRQNNNSSNLHELVLSKLILFEMLLEKGEYIKALDYLEEVEVLKSQIDSPIFNTVFYLSKADIYTALGIYDLATKYLKSAELALTQENNNEFTIQSIIIKLRLAILQKDLISAKKLFSNLSNQINRAEGYILLPEFLDQKITFSLMENDTANVLFTLDALLSLSLQKNLKYYEAKSYIYYASIFKATDIEKSHTYLNKALEIADGIGNNLLKSSCLERLVDIIEIEGDYQKALALKKELFLLKDKSSFNTIGLEVLASWIRLNENKIKQGNEFVSERNYKFSFVNVNTLMLSLFSISLVLFFVFRKKNNDKISEEGRIPQNENFQNDTDQLSYDLELNTLDTKFRINELIKELQNGNLDLRHFIREYEILNPNFSKAIENKSDGKITTTAMKNLICLKLKLSIKESANLMMVSPNTVKTYRYRLKMKLGFDKNQELTEFVQSL